MLLEHFKPWVLTRGHVPSTNLPVLAIALVNGKKASLQDVNDLLTNLGVSYLKDKRIVSHGTVDVGLVLIHLELWSVVPTVTDADM